MILLFDLVMTTGIAAGVLTSASLVPQLIKLIKEKEAQDISLAMLFVLIAGNGLWIYYGILNEDPIIIVTNSFSIMVNLFTITFTLLYKKKS